MSKGEIRIRITNTIISFLLYTLIFAQFLKQLNILHGTRRFSTVITKYVALFVLEIYDALKYK
jgi:hypothetical protein